MKRPARNSRSFLSKGFPIQQAVGLSRCFFMVLVTSIVLGIQSQAAAGELLRPLREAAELYRTGHYNAARERCQRLYQAFPNRIEPLLLFMQIEKADSRLQNAYRWLRRAAALKPRHPLVLEYQRVFEEYQHRFGPLTKDVGPQPSRDDAFTAREFKKGWFGPQFLRTSQKRETKLTKYSETPSFTPPPPGKLELSIAAIARSSLQEQRYLKAYLFYSQLHRESPHETAYLLGKAEAAIGLNKMNEALQILNSVWSDDQTIFDAGIVGKVTELKQRCANH